MPVGKVLRHVKDGMRRGSQYTAWSGRYSNPLVENACSWLVERDRAPGEYVDNR